MVGFIPADGRGMETTLELPVALDVEDVFVLRRVSDEQMINLDGIGRGEGWAGNITVDSVREPLIAQSMATPGVIRWTGESAARVFGPYWATDAALTMVGDYLVVFGGGQVSTHNDSVLMNAAGTAAWSAGEVSPEKRLADELEVTQAALAVASLPLSSRDEFLSALAQTAADSLACEFGAVVLREPEQRLLLAPDGWAPEASDDLILGALLQLVASLEDELLVVTQDLRDDPMAVRPLGFAQGVVSRCVIPLTTDGLDGAIVVAHTDSTPRGFTALCQQVAERIGSQASQVLASSGVAA